MTPTDTDSLIANALCIQKCIPDGQKMAVLIYQLARIAGLPTDQAGIQSLLDNSRCVNNCIPPGMQWAVLVGLFAKIAGTDPVPPPAQNTNLIPAGAVYDAIGRYYLRGVDPSTEQTSNIIQYGNTYLLTYGANEHEAIDESQGGGPLNGQFAQAGVQVQFTYNGPGGDLGFYLISTGNNPGMPVTATIYAV
jgi:hypothetical protein